MNRYDSSAMGRFTSPDPGRMNLARPQSLNRYVYAMNDPVNHIDQTGNEWFFLGYKQTFIPIPFCGVILDYRGIGSVICDVISVLVSVPYWVWAVPPPEPESGKCWTDISPEEGQELLAAAEEYENEDVTRSEDPDLRAGAVLHGTTFFDCSGFVCNITGLKLYIRA